MFDISTQNPNLLDTKRSVSVCAMPPKPTELEVAKSDAEQRREQLANEHNAFLNELGVLVEVLHEDNRGASGDPLEKRILHGVKVVKQKWLQVQEERDVLKKNNQELETKLGEIFAGFFIFI